MLTDIHDDIDDFEVLEFEDSDNEDLGGWTVLGEKKDSAINPTIQMIQEKLRSRGSPDELRHRGILRERQDNYSEGKCPGAAMSKWTGSALQSKNNKGANLWLKREVTRMLIQEIREQSKTDKITGRSGVGRGRGDNIAVAKRPELPRGRHYFVGTGPGVKCEGKTTKTSNYFVGSGPTLQSSGATTTKTSNYFVGAGPGVSLNNGFNEEALKVPSDPNKSDCSDAYRHAYTTFSPSVSKIMALERGLIKAMLHKAQDPKARANEARAALSSLRGINRPAMNYRASKLTRQLSRDRVCRQLERARYARVRGYHTHSKAQAFADEMAEKVRMGWTGSGTGKGPAVTTSSRDELLREAHVTEEGVKYAHKRIRSWTQLTGTQRILATSICTLPSRSRSASPTSPNRDELMRQEFAAAAAIQHAHKQVREFAIGGVKGSGTGIIIEAEKAVNSSREEQIRQDFANSQKIISAHKHVREFSIGHLKSSKGSGKDISSRDDLLREAHMQVAAKKAANAIQMQRQMERSALVPSPAPITLTLTLELEAAELQPDETSNASRNGKGKKKKKRRRKSKTKENTKATNTGVGAARVTYAGQQGSSKRVKAKAGISAQDADAWVRERYVGKHGRCLSVEENLKRNVYLW